MATKARQQYHADETTLSKERREFSISDAVQEKIEGIEEGAQVNTIETIRVNGNEISPDENKAIDLTIPGVIDSLSSTSITDALSARQGKILYDKIDNISRIGHFLALWDASTGLPVTDPEVSPYEYHAGDFYTISVVASQGGTNYKPSGTEYISGQASTAVETDDVEVNDFYFYDGQVWRHMKNSGAGSIAIDESLSTTSTNPVENRVITNALNGKANAIDVNTKTFYLSSTSDLVNAQAAYDWYVAGKNPIIRISGWNYSFILQGNNSEPTYHLGFYGVNGRTGNGASSSYIGINPKLELRRSSNTVTSVVVTSYSANTLFTDVDYSTPYTPQYNGSPATKKYVDDSVSGAVSKGTTAPSNPTEGQLWYDTTNDVLKVYDGTNWNVTGNEYNAGEGISIGTVQDYSAMRGPAPSGFHVPLNTEWQAVKDIWTALGGGSSDGTNFGIALKLPFAGLRSYSSARVNSQDSYGYYWSSSRYNANYAYHLDFNSSDITPQSNGHSRACGFSVRCFKDTPTIPTSSWAKLYGTSIEAGGIFWSSTDGLISLSSDGTDWITIADKNLGATTVWNSGDTLSEANCGKYYQWGNNYGFPRTGSVTTSSTQVDASTYGPGNYYSSSTFITRSSSPYRWDTTDNGNLRGGTTGVVTLNNVISNTGVLSVNGQTGNVTVKEYNAGEGIEIGTYNDYSAMRGPCPRGFHVPMRDELTTLYSYMNTLGLTDTGENFKEKLLLPNASKLAQNTGQRESYSTYAYLRSCNPYNTFGAKTIQISNSTIYHGNSDFNSKSGGDTIRPFKDTSVSPNSSWTALYDGSSVAAGAGVFHNESLGLISVSSDGINWITLADKNLGATVAYNVGDTLSEANCGKFYQWGNNYGFPWTGATTTSSTKVDASNYGPGNYYSSSTFIIAENASSSTAWDTTSNQNLRGGETGVVTLDNAISNTGVLSVNGQTGDVTISTPEESNTKTFYLSGTSDLTNAQAAYDWYKSGKNIIIVYLPEVSSTSYNMGVYIPCTPQSVSSNVCNFISVYKAWEQAIAGDNAGGGIYEYILYFSISGSTVTSINRSTRKSIANFLATDKTNRAYTPTNNYHPATKKYVDDSVSGAVSKGTTAPSNPTEGQLWYDTTNDILKVYNGTQWNAVGDDAADINTKTFYLSSTSDLTNAQAAYDWYKAGKNPIIVYDNKEYILSSVASNALTFTCTKYTIGDGSTASGLTQTNTYIFFSGDTVSSVTNTASQTNKLLATDVNYSTPYIPQYPGSPATKKYVDDSVIEYNAGEGIEIGTVQDYSAMRGPCPKGFHIPTNSELQNIINIGNALSAWSTPAQCESILNLTNHDIINWQGGYIMALNGAYIWSCTPNNSGQSYAFSTAANKIQVKSSENRNSGYQIRPFKDKPEIPNNTRTTLFDGSSIAAGAGIFSNSSLGLISLSSDGENRTTIAIKNLGAPDTTSAGYYYQRGNNNGFVANGYTTSETTVNASNYGPMNYYNSNVFIMGNNGVWDNSNNRNLRGGLTGVVTLNNAITNTGALSVNGQTGDVTLKTINNNALVGSGNISLNVIFSGAITPAASSQYEGKIFYNTADKVFYTCDGTQWSKIGGGGFELAPNSPLSPKYRRYGTQAQYEALTQYYTDEVGDTVYYTI